METTEHESTTSHRPLEATSLDHDILSVDIMFDETINLRRKLSKKLIDSIDSMKLDLDNGDFEQNLSKLKAIDSMSSLLNDMDKNTLSRANLKLKKKDSEALSNSVNVLAIMQSMFKGDDIYNRPTEENYCVDDELLNQKISDALDSKGVIILDSELSEDNDTSDLSEDVREYMKENNMME